MSEWKYSDEQLATVLTTFLNRLDRNALQELVAAHTQCWQGQANGNAGSQQDADENLESVALKSVEALLRYDKVVLSRLILVELDPNMQAIKHAHEEALREAPRG